MPRQTKHSWGGLLTAGLLAGAFLGGTSSAFGQVLGGSVGGTTGGFGGVSTGSSMGGASFGGTSTGGFGSSSFGGSSFSGGSGGFGGSFGSSGQGFSGGGGFGNGFGTTTAGSTFRTTAGAAAAATGVAPYSVSTSNPFGTYYVNPLSLGMPGTTGRTSFGTPLYTLNSTGTTGITGSFGTGLQGSTYGQGSSGSLAGTGGQLSVPYVATLENGFTGNATGPVITSGRLLTELRQVLARSTSLPSKDRIQVFMQGGVVVLQGTVSDDHERRLAAGLVSLTPGVHGIRNDLQVSGAAGGPTSP